MLLLLPNGQPVDLVRIHFNLLIGLRNYAGKLLRFIWKAIDNVSGGAIGELLEIDIIVGMPF